MPRHSPYAIPHQRDTELCQPVNADISLILAGPGGLAARPRFCTRVGLNTDICARSGLNTNATSAHLHAREFVRPPVLLREIGVGGDVVAEGLSRWVENDGAPQMVRNIPEMADRRTQPPHFDIRVRPVPALQRVQEILLVRSPCIFGGAPRQRYRGIAREGFPGRVEEQGPAERGYRSGAAEYDDLPSREYCAPSGAHHRFRPIN